MSALTKMSFKLLGFLKAKTGGSLKILHSSGCFCMVVQCSPTMLDKLLSAGWYVMTNGTLLFVLFFILDEVFSVNTTCFVKAMVNARIVVTPLFQMTFQFPEPFFGGLFVGADAFDSESLALSIAPKVFRTAKLSESNASAPTNKPPEGDRVKCHFLVSQ